ncbi:transcriptional regulator [Microbacterium sp.]|uniref:winged helix-turn-helix domain-containing protein n=1 Tax=Microbacterium sp. TaxID=51671 RepID=UPI00273502C1|nr:transcriptional regulator [Microbacterium sp.]MDP3949354.1 transcriptional regulator [Microbacterium sp.]
MTTAPGANAHSGGDHPRHRLEQQLLHAVRFSIVATLAASDTAEFGFVRDTIEVSDSMLSKQVALLENAGYVAVQKGYVGKRPRTWLRLTSNGRAAFSRHLDALRAITTDSET